MILDPVIHDPALLVTRGRVVRRRRDDGSALPFAIVMITAIAAVTMAILNYVITDLRAGEVAESRSDRLSAADAGMRYAIDQLKLRNAGCVLDTQKAVLPGADVDFNGASASVVCERITSGYEGIQAYAAVITGEGLSPSDSLTRFDLVPFRELPPSRPSAACFG